MPGGRGRERGQASVEFVALLALVALALASLAWVAGLRLPGVALGRSLAERLICAVRLSDSCRSDPALYATYGGELAGLTRLHAPRISYEEGMRALPVDYRRCRADACAEGPASGAAVRAASGERSLAFTHVIDCRDPAAAASRGFECSGERAGHLYLQYWFYYPGSATAEGSLFPRQVRRASAALGRSSFHHDDWESYQVRIGPNGAVAARASSHHGYNGRGGVRSWASDAGAAAVNRVVEASGLRPPGGWQRSRGRLYVSGGSHAGHTSEADLRPALARYAAAASLIAGGKVPEGRFAARERRRLLGAEMRRLRKRWIGPGRYTPRGSLQLVPIESLRRSGTRFAVTPPWRKRVYYDPEYAGTD